MKGLRSKLLKKYRTWQEGNAELQMKNARRLAAINFGAALGVFCVFVLEPSVHCLVIFPGLVVGGFLFLTIAEESTVLYEKKVR